MRTHITALVALAVSTCAPVPAYAAPQHPHRLGAVYGAPSGVLAALYTHAEDDEELAVALTWGEHESGFQNSPVRQSWDSRAGMSRCFMQVRSSRELSLDECAATWFAMLRAAKAKCGSLEGGLRALSSGSCTLAHQLVDERVDEAEYALELAGLAR